MKIKFNNKKYLYLFIVLIIIVSIVLVYSANIIYDGEPSHTTLWTKEIRSKNTENKISIFGNLCLNNKCISSWKDLCFTINPPTGCSLGDTISCSLELGDECDSFSTGIRNCKEDGTFGECEEPFVGCCQKYVYNSAGSVNLGCSNYADPNAESTYNYCSVGTCYKCKEGYKVYNRLVGCEKIDISGKTPYPISLCPSECARSGVTQCIPGLLDICGYLYGTGATCIGGFEEYTGYLSGFGYCNYIQMGPNGACSPCKI